MDSKLWWDTAYCTVVSLLSALTIFTELPVHAYIQWSKRNSPNPEPGIPITKVESVEGYLTE